MITAKKCFVILFMVAAILAPISKVASTVSHHTSAPMLTVQSAPSVTPAGCDPFVEPGDPFDPDPCLNDPGPDLDVPGIDDPAEPA
jgi:hypothetical protein